MNMITVVSIVLGAALSGGVATLAIIITVCIRKYRAGVKH